MNTVRILIALLTLTFVGQAGAMQGMNHSGTTDGKTQNFKHMAMVDGIHAEFQIMDLAAMNMTDPNGKTHHVMATFSKNDQKITKAVGKVKLIAPSGKEQLETFKDYGNGIFAANFNLNEPGKWGVICLFKDDSGKHAVKFWYSHHMM